MIMSRTLIEYLERQRFDNESLNQTAIRLLGIEKPKYARKSKYDLGFIQPGSEKLYQLKSGPACMKLMDAVVRYRHKMKVNLRAQALPGFTVKVSHVI